MSDAAADVDPLAGEFGEEFLAELVELDAALRANPLLGYNNPDLSRELHPKQLEFHASRDPLKLLLGGNRSGKTTAGIADDLVQSLDEADVPEHLRPFKKWQPPFYCRLVIPDLTKNLDGVILQKVREWCPPSALRGGSVEKAWNDRLGVLSFANGSWWQIMSNDQDVGKFGGSALHRVHYDEEPLEAIRRECIMRLVDFDGDELFTMTPLLGLTWLYGEIFEPWEQGGLPGCTIVIVDMDDNPHLSTEAKERVLAAHSSQEREARKKGRFVHFAGLVYPQFDRDFHVIPAIDELPEGVKVLQGIDPGIRHMTGVVFCYLDADDTLVVFDELAVRDLTVEQIAGELHARDSRWGVVPYPRIIDPSARNRQHVTGHSVQHEFQQQQIYTALGHNARPAGINAVQERLERREPAGLLVTASCVELIAEFGRYRWASPPRNAESRVREEPVRRDDDVIDALRYVCMSDPVKPPPVRAPETAAQVWARKRLQRTLEERAVYPGGPGMYH